MRGMNRCRSCFGDEASPDSEDQGIQRQEGRGPGTQGQSQSQPAPARPQGLPRAPQPLLGTGRELPQACGSRAARHRSCHGSQRVLPSPAPAPLGARAVPRGCEGCALAPISQDAWRAVAGASGKPGTSQSQALRAQRSPSSLDLCSAPCGHRTQTAACGEAVGGVRPRAPLPSPLPPPLPSPSLPSPVLFPLILMVPRPDHVPHRKPGPGRKAHRPARADDGGRAGEREGTPGSPATQAGLANKLPWPGLPPPRLCGSLSGPGHPLRQ